MPYRKQTLDCETVEANVIKILWKIEKIVPPSILHSKKTQKNWDKIPNVWVQGELPKGWWKVRKTLVVKSCFAEKKTKNFFHIFLVTKSSDKIFKIKPMRVNRRFRWRQ